MFRILSRKFEAAADLFKSRFTQLGIQGLCLSTAQGRPASNSLCIRACTTLTNPMIRLLGLLSEKLNADDENIRRVEVLLDEM